MIRNWIFIQLTRHNYHTHRQLLFFQLKIFRFKIHCVFSQYILLNHRFTQIVIIIWGNRTLIYWSTCCIELKKELPLSFIYTILDCFCPFVILLLLGETNVNRHRFFVRNIVNGLQNKAEVIFVFGLPQNIVPHVVRFDFLLSLSKHKLFIQIKPELLLLPSFDVETSGVANGIDNAWVLGLEGFEVIVGKVENVIHERGVVLNFLLPGQSGKSQSKLFSDLVFPVFAAVLLLFSLVEIDSDVVLAKI